jgi:raffinose/stachyose/melibiose transport system permease protein
MLNRRFPGRWVFRLLFFLPYVLSEAVTGIVFRLLLQPDGFVDAAMRGVGLGGLVQDWLGDPAIVMYTLFVIISWKYFGFHMILMLAGLQGIPKELEEAARIDGAGRREVFRYVTLPLLGPTIRVSVFLSIIGALQLFDMVWVTTNGGPLTASTTMAISMFKAGFKSQAMGYGSALAVLLFIVSLVIALAYQRLVLRRDTEGALTSFGA